MADYNLVLNTGDYENGKINTVIEIPMGSFLKIEWHRQTATFVIDRVEPKIFAKPVNYGFIPQTIDEDGDELDTLVICDEPIPTGVWLEGNIIGVLNFEDDGEMDYKIIVVPADDRNTGNTIKTLDDLSDRWRQQIEEHFKHYKDLKKPGTTKVLGWGDKESAIKIVSDCVLRFKNSH